MALKTRYLEGLDSIRFLCAVWVVMSHLGNPPVFEGISKATPTGWFIRGLYGNIVSGPAAVIVFFVISGICIHFPHAKYQKIPSIGAYLIRRYVRILPPMIVAMFIAKYTVHIDLSLFKDSILWSLFAELVYYTIYPIVLHARRLGVPMIYLVIAAFIGAAMVISTNPTAKDYPSYGLSATWILGLPCWLMGCLIAEKTLEDIRGAPTYTSIWTMRIAILILSALSSVLRFHTSVGYPWTLTAFAIPTGIWLLLEIRFFRTVAPPAMLEWAGSWSYSLYLVHLIAYHALILFFIADLGKLPAWTLEMLFIFVFAFVFSQLIERPSHKLARTLYRLVPNTVVNR